jgi:hypothetical protein
MHRALDAALDEDLGRLTLVLYDALMLRSEIEQLCDAVQMIDGECVDWLERDATRPEVSR